MKLLPTITLIILAFAGQGDKPSQTATTEDGRRVILKSDGTWKYAEGSNKTGLSVDGLNEKQITAFKSATLALRKLGDAVSFGLTRSQYMQKMGETKTLIDDAQMMLPDGDIRRELQGTWASYVQAATWWEILKDSNGLPVKPGEVEGYLKELPRLKMASPGAVTRIEILTACWVDAQEKLKPLVELAAQK